MYLIKFMATISITLTFFVYMLLLAPTNSQGFIGAYLNNGAGSLCVHFITPVLAIIDFLLFSEHYRPDKTCLLFSSTTTCLCRLCDCFRTCFSYKMVW